jgi:hypothetical protein
MKLRALIITLLVLIGTTYADTVQSVSTPPVTVAQNVTFEHCYKIFATNKTNLFYLTLAGINANKFTVDEIQSENGYIIFTAAHNKYLATVGSVDSNNAILKITPCNNTYIFPPGIVLNMFKYIELNIS